MREVIGSPCAYIGMIGSRRKVLTIFEEFLSEGIATPEQLAEYLPLLFDLGCKDADWIRLLEWEALRGGEKPVIDEAERRAAAARGVERIRRRQASGHLSDEFDARHVLLAIIGLTMYPVAFPQLTRLITGRNVSDPIDETASVAWAHAPE